MPYVSHRSATNRMFDCVYDPDYTVSTEEEKQKLSLNAVSIAAREEIRPKFNVMFQNAPKENRLQYHKRLHFLHNERRLHSAFSEDSIIVQPNTERLAGGANIPNIGSIGKAFGALKRCKTKSQVSNHNPNTNVTIVNVELNGFQTNIGLRPFTYCKQYAELPKPPRFQTRGCQTMYRESSAQTLPYLPGVKNELNDLESLEIFKLPTILPGDKPPGLYEVEILERARKRWAFAKALKEKFTKQITQAREKTKQYECKRIMEYFEWEHWIEREENIQECQMLRLEIVIRMFNRREKEMHDNAKIRIEMACKMIEAKRKEGLHKNQIEYDRTIRRLEMKKRNVPRNWRKENITKQFGNPCSEFYAPQMRYGVSPSRRHFEPKRKDLYSGLDNIEKETVIDLNKYECPFAKLKRWSKPKGVLREVEQNFCSDKSLKNLYESLKNLRQQSAKKSKPKCLLEKSPKYFFEHDAELYTENKKIKSKKPVDEKSDRSMKQFMENLTELSFRKDNEKELMSYFRDESLQEEFENLICGYEGSVIGWIMRFLSDEMIRLQGQRKLHFITMLAQKERWRREAAEAGLRQKENEMREIYEKFYTDIDESYSGVVADYLYSILTVDVREMADSIAESHIVKLAKSIDDDIHRWLGFFGTIQNPLNFDHLRVYLRDMIFPNKTQLIKQYEAHLISLYIIDEVLFPHVFKLCEPFDIATYIVNDAIDRLIDTDLYYISTDSDECTSSDSLCEAELEASAIVRKLIRYVTPGRRWKTEDERAAINTSHDIVDQILDEMEKRPSLWEPKFRGYSLRRTSSFYDIIGRKRRRRSNKFSIKSESEDDSFEDNVVFKSQKRISEGTYREITKSLTSFEKLQNIDPSLLSFDKSIENVLEYQSVEKDKEMYLSTLTKVASAFDILSTANFAKTCISASDITSDGSSLKSETIQRIFGTKTPQQREKLKKMSRSILKNVVRSFIPAEEGDSEETISGQDEEEQIEEEAEVESTRDESSSEQLLKPIFRKLLENISNGSEEIGSDEISYSKSIEELPLGSIEYEETPEVESDSVQLIISEQQLEKMLDTELCKCKDEIERENFIKDLMQKGKVRVSKYEENEDDDESVETINTFAYETDNEESEETIMTYGEESSIYESDTIDEEFVIEQY